MKELTGGQGQWHRTRTISNAFINRGDLTEVGKVWFYFVNSVFKPSKQVSTVRQNHAILLYALVKGYALNVGKIMEESILDYAKGKFSGNIPHPSLITLLCIKGGVKFNEVEEERCPKASPLTLARVFKAPIESEEGERREKPTKKKKRAETEEMRDQALVAASGEGNNSERGGYEAHLEQLMLSSTTDQRIPYQTEVENEESYRAEQLSIHEQRKKKGKIELQLKLVVILNY